MDGISNFTKQAIKRSFVALLQKKPLPQITVKDIVEECGINRNSFYYHFQDIPTLIDELITEETGRLIVDYSPQEPLESCLKTAYAFVETNREMILHVYNYMDRGAFESYLWRICDQIVEAYAKNEFSKTALDDTDRAIITRFYRCGCFGLLLEWLNGTLRGCTEEEIDRFCLIQKSMLAEFDRRCRTEKD